MLSLTKTLLSAALVTVVGTASVQANTVTLIGTLHKQATGTTFDAWNFNIAASGHFTVDVAAYEASQSNVATAGYYTHDINGDGELTWLDPDTYFYQNSGTALQATDAIVRCDDVQNNCAIYQNGWTAATSPLVVTTHLQSETPVDGSVHFRRDPWFDVAVTATGNYKYLVADYLLSPSEAQSGINGNDNFSAPSGYASPILDHADYTVTLSSATLNFAVSGNTVTVTAVPVPGAAWLFASGLMAFWGWRRKTI